MPLAKVQVSTRPLNRIESAKLAGLGFTVYGQTPIWMEDSEGKVVKTDWKGSSGNQSTMMLIEARCFFEQRVLQIIGSDGHTIFTFGSFAYGLPTGEMYKLIHKSVPGEVNIGEAYFKDDNRILYIVDILQTKMSADDAFYKSLVISGQRVPIGGYLIRQGLITGWWQDGRFVPKPDDDVVNLSTIKCDPFSLFMLKG